MQTAIEPLAQPDGPAVEAVQRGDAERYRELVERHERRVFAVAWSRLGDPHLAEEATQEAFIRGYRHLKLLGEGAKFASWITSIARNVAINLGLRHRRELNKRERWALEQITAPTERQNDEPAELCPPETLRQTLAELPAAHRECLVLFYLEGRSGAEAAATLGISEPSFRVRLHRARAALREQLEGKLEGSLERLRPARTLVPAVMAAILVPSSAKAATAGGALGLGVGAKLLTSAGKVLPLASLFLLMQIVAILPGMAFASWVGRMERRNYREAGGFRARLHQDYYRSYFLGYPLVFILIMFGIATLGAHAGQHHFYLVLSVFMGGMVAVQARTMLINRNRFQVGALIYTVILAGGMVVAAAGLLAPRVYPLFFIAATLWSIGFLRDRPIRMDYSLFLRAAKGMLGTPTPDSATTDRATRLAKTDLVCFARFLGSRWLAANFRWDRNGLALRLPWVKTKFLRNMGSVFVPISRGCSQVLLRWDGTVVAHCGATDAAGLADLKPGDNVNLAELELQVSTTLEHAWREVRNGNAAAAERVVGEAPDSEVFIVAPSRASSTRWLRITIGAAATVMAVSLVMNWQEDKLKMVNGRHLRPVSFTESEVRAALARFGDDSPAGSNALHQEAMSRGLAEVWPPQSLFTPSAWQTTHAKFFQRLIYRDGTALQRVDRLLGTPDLWRAIANGWLSLEDLGLTREEVRSGLLEAPEAARRRWFAPQENQVSNQDGTRAGYTVLNTEHVAGRVQCLKRLGCLEAVDGSAMVETLLKHQILSGQLPAGRRKLAFPKLLHGTFLTSGWDPIRDTYRALVILDGFGALDRVDREACIGGILRFHHGRGLFGSVRQGDGFVIFGDSRDTFWAFESLRMLGELDRVKDLAQWQFRPNLMSQPGDSSAPRNMTWEVIEAWVCQQRLEQILRDRKANPQAPVRSLLEP